MPADEAHGFRVRAVRSGSWWAITVPELPGVFSQAKRLDQVETMAREAVSMMLEVDTDQISKIEVEQSEGPVRGRRARRATAASGGRRARLLRRRRGRRGTTRSTR